MIVLFFILFLSSLNSINFFSGVINTKPGEVYLGTTHYYEDYFFYLNHFTQAAHGAWLTANRYTTEAISPSIMFWPNILLGKLGGAGGLAPQWSYNLSVFLLSFTILFFTYQLMQSVFNNNKSKALIAFFFTTTATSFMNRIWVDGTFMWYPFLLWKTPNLAFDRLGAVPHQLVQTLLFLLLVYVWFFIQKRKLIFSTVLITLLTTLNPVVSGLFLLTSWITGRGNFLVSVVFLIVALYYNSLTNTQPHIQSKLWEAGQQVATTGLFMMLSIGPIVILGVLGLRSIFLKPKPIMTFGAVLLIICYLLFFSPIPKFLGVSNSRVLFPALYVFWGALAVEGLKFKISNFKFQIILLSIFFLLTLPTLYWEIQQKLVVRPHERIPLLYLPREIYDGFTYLSSLSPLSDVVLASPATHMDSIVPALSGHTSYTGHAFATISSNEKKAISSKFFAKNMTSDQARQWLARQNIKYIFFTNFDGDKSQFQLKYNFLKELYGAQTVTIYEK